LKSKKTDNGTYSLGVTDTHPTQMYSSPVLQQNQTILFMNQGLLKLLRTALLMSVSSGLDLQRIKEEVSDPDYLFASSSTQREAKETWPMMPGTQHPIKSEWNKLVDG